MMAYFYIQKKPSKGFTLIELLVVIAIIALLLSVMMPALRRAREQARKVVSASNIKQISIGLYTYAADYNGYLPMVRYWSHATQDLSPQNAQNVNIQMTVLYVLKYLPEKKLYYSPSDRERQLDTVGVFRHPFRPDTRVNNQEAWDLIEQGRVSDDNLTLTYSYQQVLHVAESLNDIEGPDAERFLKISGTKTLVADRFCGNHIWSYYNGDEDLSLFSAPQAENGDGWHIGMTDGSVVWQANDQDIFDYMQRRVQEFGGGFHWHHSGAWFNYMGRRQ